MRWYILFLGRLFTFFFTFPLLAQMDSLVHEFMIQSRAPGLFVAVVREDSIVFQGAYGTAELSRKTPLSAAMGMELGSISKIFTAEIVCQLIRSGKLKLNDPVQKYLPEAPDSWSDITIGHLLGHTSGLMNYLADPRFMAESYFLNQSDVRAQRFFDSLSTDRMREMFYSLPLEFKPGDTWSYSNTGYYLLGIICQNVTGKSYFELVREFVTIPLGMNHTMANDSAELGNFLSRGYFVKDSALLESRHLSSNYAFSAGALASTGEDMIRFMMAIHMHYFPSDLIGYEWRKPPSLDWNLPFAYQDGKFYSDFHGYHIISHNGGTPGFSSSWIYVVEKKLSIVILLNLQDYAPTDQLAWDILSSFDPDLKYPNLRIPGESAKKMENKLVNIMMSISSGSEIPSGLSKPLSVLLSSENGRGYWKWYFGKGFPKDAWCVDVERLDDFYLYRFILPFSGSYHYRLSLVQNDLGEICQLRWW